jgi:hypothetical protein
MAIDAHDLERVVAEVLRRLRDFSAKTVRGRDEFPVPQQAMGVTHLTIEDRVVTMKLLDGNLDGITHVFVPGDAVVTPLVRDELRQRNVRVEFAADSRSSSTTGMVVVMADVDDALQRVVETLAQPGGCVDQIVRGRLAQAVVTGIGRVRGDGRRALILTRSAHVAVCLANRSPGVRAVTAQNEPAARDAIRSVSANVLVVDPAGIGDVALSDLITMFSRCETSICPAELREPA